MPSPVSVYLLSQSAPVGFLAPCNGFQFLFIAYQDTILPVLFSMSARNYFETFNFHGIHCIVLITLD